MSNKHKSKMTAEIPGERVSTRASSHVSTYTDDTQLSLNFYGFTFRFNQLLGKDEKKGHLVVEEKAVVSMSPEHGQALFDLLGRQLKRYVELYGPLRSKDESAKEDPPTH